MFEKDKKIVNPISFKNKDDFKIKAVSKIDEQINNSKAFAISKTTENGKYMRGNMLYYSLNGIEIYTEPNNIIFVDLKNKTLWIKEYSKVQKQITPEDPENRQYVMLYTDLGYDDPEEEIPLRWEAVTGRLNAYENIKVNLPVIDLDKSLVLVDTVALQDSLTVRQFVEWLKNSDIVKDDIDLANYSSEYY